MIFSGFSPLRISSALLFGSFLAIASSAISPSPASAEQPATLDAAAIRRIVREELEKIRAEEKANAQPQSTGAALESKVVNRLTQDQPVTETADATSSESQLDNQIAGSGVSSPLSGKTGPFDLRLKGYGDLQYAYYDYPETITQPEGSRGESRAGFDTTRFVMELEGEHEPSGVEFEAEVEFEHGGTGTEVELEFDEFGEFENEVDKGGEVVVEELFLQKRFGNGFTGRAGRFYVNVGLLSDYHLPTDYLGTGRSEAETSVIPAVWDEMGIEMKKQFEAGTITLQVMNGLDSTGFGASGWVTDGHQQKFEVSRAENLAYIGRFDYTDIPGVVLGSSIYYADATTDNRPKDDLDADGGLLIVDGHFYVKRDRFRSQGMFLWGKLDDAGAISDRNSRLPNSLGVERTPIGDEAIATWAELGYDILPSIGASGDHQLFPFFRFDYYDTYFDTREDLIDNDRFERSIYTAGVSYVYQEILVTKLDYTYREFGTSDIDSQNMVRAEVGFVY